MNPKNNLSKIAEETLQILKDGQFFTPGGAVVDIKRNQEYAVNNTVVYSPILSDELLTKHIPHSTVETCIDVTGESSLAAVIRLIQEGHKDVVCLNFASAKNPGGGFLGGAQAQEESIARSSGLYPCQLGATAYYEANRHTKSCFYTDYMIYSPSVPILKKDDGTTVDELMTAAIITAPAVNTGVIKHREANRLHEIETVMKRRMEKVLAIAVAHGHKTIILGAWGCGVFQNDPAEIAKYFKDIIDTRFKHDFEKIVFAVYARDERFITPFIEYFDK
ncbi:MAG: TIGR02452 family protein [Saprospiraceae bacterium]|nr:TIGR02452 family protein [Saprospiraceae bacterium]